MDFLLNGINGLIENPQYLVMYLTGALLIYLAIKKDLEPALLLPMGFGAILVNLPYSGVYNTAAYQDEYPLPVLYSGSLTLVLRHLKLCRLLYLSVSAQ